MKKPFKTFLWFLLVFSFSSSSLAQSSLAQSTSETFEECMQEVRSKVKTFREEAEMFSAEGHRLHLLAMQAYEENKLKLGERYRQESLIAFSLANLARANARSAESSDARVCVIEEQERRDREERQQPDWRP